MPSIRLGFTAPRKCVCSSSFVWKSWPESHAESAGRCGDVIPGERRLAVALTRISERLRFSRGTSALRRLQIQIEIYRPAPNAIFTNLVHGTNNFN
jgi:hypothetical protein